jgi:hypothetical protein
MNVDIAEIKKTLGGQLFPRLSTNGPESSDIFWKFADPGKGRGFQRSRTYQKLKQQNKKER